MKILPNRIHKGFDSLEEAINYGKDKDIEKLECYKIICFNKMYYLVGFQNLDKEIIISKEEIWYREEGYMRKVINDVHHDTINKYQIASAKTPVDFIDGIYRDMCKVSSTYVRMFHIQKKDDINYTTKKYTGKKNCYFVLLGLTFYNYDFTKEDITKIKKYFNSIKSYKHFLESNSIIVSINPFTSKAKIRCNKEIKEVGFRPVYHYDGFRRILNGFALEKKFIR